MSDNYSQVTTVSYDYDWVIWYDTWTIIFIGMAVSVPVGIFVGCCRYNHWYRKFGPFADLAEDEALCPSGDRCRAARHLCRWCQRRRRKPTSGPSTANEPDDGTAMVFVISEQVDATRYVLPPPSYEAALSMRRPKRGEIVRFISGTGNDGVVFEFSMPTNDTPNGRADAVGGNDFGTDVDDCDPPVYCWPTSWSYMQSELDETAPVDIESMHV